MRRLNQPNPANLSKNKATTSSSIATAITTSKNFHFFVKLPKDLRLKIWGMATEEQRVVIIDLDRPGESHAELMSSSPPPAILHACVESREAGLKSYSLSFGGPTKPARIYFNFDQDILFLHRSRRDAVPVYYMPVTSPPLSLADAFGTKDVERVQYLGHDLSTKNDYRASLHWEQLKNWLALKCLYLGLQGPELDLNDRIRCIPLPKEDYKTFSKAYFRNVRFSPPEASMPWYPLSARIEWVKAKCVRPWDTNTSFDEMGRLENIRSTVKLVMMVNSSSLMVE